jgi:pimeloyl-ACP methyl ester carboxylesterase
VDVTFSTWKLQLSVPHLVSVRGARAEVARAALCLAGLPVGLAGRGLRQLTARDDPHVSVVPRQKETGQSAACLPILLVHGLADRTSNFAALRRSLRDLGAGPVTEVGYSPLSPDIRSSARALGTQIEQVHAESSGPVCVIGYSLGGLIARYYVQRLAGHARVPLVITLATPHRGTATALLAPPHPLLRQLRPDSDLVAELAEPAPGCRTRFVALYSDLDEAVIPANRARIDHPDLDARNILIHGVGHLTLPTHKTVIDTVCRVLIEARHAMPAAHLDHAG